MWCPHKNDYFLVFYTLYTNKISESRLSKLKCRYLNQDPLIRISPVKEEQVYDDPPIWIFHDVITDKQIEEMKTLASFKVRFFS